MTVNTLRGHRSGVHVGVNTHRPYYRPSYRPRVVRHYNYPGYRYRPTVRIYHSYPDRYYDPYYYPYYYPYYPNTIRIYGSIPPVVVNHVNVNPVAPVVVQSPTVQVSRQSSLISKAIREGSDDRKQAVRELSGYPDIASVAVLLDVLINDGDDEVRRAAAKSLGEIGDPTAYEALMRSAASEQSERVRDEAVAAADHIKLAVSEQELYLSPKMPPMNTGKEKLGQLLEEIRFGNHEVREDAVKDLDDYPGTQSVCALINVLINDPEEDIREDAAESLGKIGDRMVLPFLDWALYNDPDDEVRKNSKKAIEKIYDTIQ